jgi:hypothetical protein
MINLIVKCSSCLKKISRHTSRAEINAQRRGSDGQDGEFVRVTGISGLDTLVRESSQAY